MSVFDGDLPRASASHQSVRIFLGSTNGESFPSLSINHFVIEGTLDQFHDIKRWHVIPDHSVHVQGICLLPQDREEEHAK